MRTGEIIGRFSVRHRCMNEYLIGEPGVVLYDSKLVAYSVGLADSLGLSMLVGEGIRAIASKCIGIAPYSSSFAPIGMYAKEGRDGMVEIISDAMHIADGAVSRTSYGKYTREEAEYISREMLRYVQKENVFKTSYDSLMADPVLPHLCNAEAVRDRIRQWYCGML